jgi:hypothetical protein
MLNQALWDALNGGSLSKNGKLNSYFREFDSRAELELMQRIRNRESSIRWRFSFSYRRSEPFSKARPEWEIRYRSLLQFNQVT